MASNQLCITGWQGNLHFRFFQILSRVFWLCNHIVLLNSSVEHQFLKVFQSPVSHNETNTSLHVDAPGLGSRARLNSEDGSQVRLAIPGSWPSESPGGVSWLTVLCQTTAPCSGFSPHRSFRCLPPAWLIAALDTARAGSKVINTQGFQAAGQKERPGPLATSCYSWPTEAARQFFLLRSSLPLPCSTCASGP